MRRYECDRCGKTTRLEEMHTAKVGKIGASAIRTYDLCEECARKARSMLSKFMLKTSEVAR